MPIALIDKIKPKNGSFPIADAQDVEMPDGSRLSDFSPVKPITEEEYSRLEADGTWVPGILYAAIPSGGDGT